MMAQEDIDEFEALAIDYALGILVAEEREAVRERSRRDPLLRNAISFWESRLAPLCLAVPGMAVQRDLLGSIFQRIESMPPAGAGSSKVVQLQRRLAGWRLATAGITAIAASLALVIAAREFRPPPQTGTLVAVLQKDSASPAFLISVDLETRLLTVKPVAAKPEAGKSYELWLVSDKLAAPKSLGVVGEQDFTVNKDLAKLDPTVANDGTYAISLEPEGGSPTGAPTGPVLFTGKLIPVTADQKL